MNGRAASTFSGQIEENLLTEWAAWRWHENGFKKGTMERLSGVKIFRATVRSRGEVGIVAGKLRSTPFAQTASLS
jgi:hypothetical protein